MISFNCCYDDYTDIEKCVNFFVENSELFYPMYVLYSYISPYDTTYYQWLEDKMKEEGREKCFNESYKRVRDHFINGDYKTKAELAAVENLLLGAYSMAVRNRNDIHALNNCCIPLSKLAVYPDGTYTICEKMNKRFPIGNVKEGINYDEIQRVTDKLINNLNSGKCSMCPVKRMCTACFQFMDENERINTGFCERQKKSVKNMLVDYCDMKERNPLIIDCFVAEEEEFNYLNVLK